MSDPFPLMLNDDDRLELEMASARGGNDWQEATEQYACHLLHDACQAARLKAELAECRQYHAPRIAELERLNLEAQHRIADLCVIVGDIEQCRSVEADSITILCDNPEADSIETQSAVEANGDYTGYEDQRFYGRTWQEALRKAAACSQRHYSDHEQHE